MTDDNTRNKNTRLDTLRAQLRTALDALDEISSADPFSREHGTAIARRALREIRR